MARPAWRAVLGVGLLLLPVAACRGSESDRGAPNFLLVTLDTVRADHCSAYGYPKPTTPALERLAREGVLLEEAYAPMPTTAPSHASMLTSRYPISHGVTKNGIPLRPELDTLAEILSARGYETAAFVGAFPLHRSSGFSQGFDTYDDEFPREGSTVPDPRGDGRSGLDRRADAVAARALAWLGARKGSSRPFFLWVHFYDAHWPYVPPQPFRSRLGASPEGRPEETVALYDGEIAFADSALAALIERLDRQGHGPTTLVAVLGDHGEGLGEHGHLQHGLFVYEEAVRVPWVLRWPGRLPAGRRIAGPVEVVDLLPTVLDLFGIDAPRGAQGRSLAAALRGEPLEPDRPVFLQRRRFDFARTADPPPLRGEKFGIRSGRWKYVEAPEEGTRELYDLRADPEELENLVERFPEEAARLAARLRAWRAQHASAPADSTVLRETTEALRALGYVQ